MSSNKLAKRNNAAKFYGIPQNATFVHISPTIMAVAQNHSNNKNLSLHTAKVTVFIVIMIL